MSSLNPQFNRIIRLFDELIGVWLISIAVMQIIGLKKFRRFYADRIRPEGYCCGGADAKWASCVAVANYFLVGYYYDQSPGQLSTQWRTPHRPADAVRQFRLEPIT